MGKIDRKDCTRVYQTSQVLCCIKEKRLDHAKKTKYEDRITMDKLKRWFKDKIWSEEGKIIGAAFVFLFLILLVIWLSNETHAQETKMSVGTSVISGDFTGASIIILSERWSDKFGASIGYIQGQTIERGGKNFFIKEQLIVGVERIVTPSFEYPLLNRVSLILGAYFFPNKTIVGSGNLNGRLALEIRLTDKWNVVISHWSNAGSGDVIAVPESQPRAVELECSTASVVLGALIPCSYSNSPILTGPYNKGQDAVLLQRRF